MRSLLVLAVLLSISSRSYADGFRHLVIGSWNIEFLGTRNPAQKPKPLAEHIRMSGVDLLALQEIGDTDEGPDRKNEVLDQTFDLLNQGGADWSYLLFPNKAAGDRSQLCGIAWNKKKVNKVAEPLKIDVHDDLQDQFNSWDRHPHAVKFQIEGAQAGDFVVISVHMKSNSDGQSFGRRQRNFEAKALSEKIAAVKQHFRDNDVIILGDFNALDAEEPCLQHLTSGQSQLILRVTVRSCRCLFWAMLPAIMEDRHEKVRGEAGSGGTCPFGADRA